MTKQQAEAAKVAAVRAERKAEIEAFLEVAQSVEQAAEDRYQRGSLPEDVSARTHQMWFRQKCVELVCSTALASKTLDYAWRLHEACYQEMPGGVDIWQFMTEKRTPFLKSAWQELGIANLEAKRPSGQY